jgi:hypothetical protein
VAISVPAAATPMTQLSPHPRCAHSSAARITFTFPVQQGLALDHFSAQREHVFVGLTEWFQLPVTKTMAYNSSHTGHTTAH